MAITNATTTSTTNISALSNGQKAATLRRLRGWSMSPILAAVEVVSVDDGFTGVRSASLEDYGIGSVGSISENGTLTATALPSLEAASSTLAQVGISRAWTSQALRQTAQRPEVLELGAQMIVEALVDYPCYGSSGSVKALSASFSTVTTDSGSTASLASFCAAAQEIRAFHGSQLRLLAIVSPRQRKELVDDLRASGASVLANPGVSEFAERLLTEGLGPNEVGYMFTYDNIEFYVVNRKGLLYQTGGNVYGLVLAPPATADQGIMGGIQGPLILSGTKNPAIARRNSEVVESLGPNGEIGIARYEVTESNKENAMEEVYVLEYSVFQTHATAASLPARAVLSAQDA